MAVYSIEYINSIENKKMDEIFSEAMIEIKNTLSFNENIMLQESVGSSIKNLVQRVIESIKNFFAKFITKIKEKFAKIKSKITGKPIKDDAQINREKSSNDRRSFYRGVERFEPSTVQIHRVFDDKCIKEIEDSSIIVYRFPDQIPHDKSRSIDDILNEYKCEDSERSAVIKELFSSASKGEVLPKFIRNQTPEKLNDRYYTVMRSLEKIGKAAETNGDYETLKNVNDECNNLSNSFIAFCKMSNANIDAYTYTCQVYNKYYNK